MATKKTSSKRGRTGAVKRPGAKKKVVGHGARKKVRGRSTAFLKAPRGTVVIGPGPISPYAARALSAFNKGVQQALKEMAQANIPAVVIENGRLVKAVPTKVGGRYIVSESQVLSDDRRSAGARKRGVRVG